MPYSKISEARIKKLNNVPLTLAQINSIARVADALEGKGGIDNPWAVAISQFKKSHHVEGDKWVKNKKKSEAKEMVITPLDMCGVAVDYIMKALDDYFTDTEFDDVSEEPQEDVSAYSYKTTLSNVLEAAIHNVATDVADKLYGLGYMTRAERIALSNAIGDALEAYANADSIRGILTRPVDKFDVYDFFKERGKGKGVGRPPQGDGGADICVCSECGTTAPHEKGVPCAEMKCPKCGAAMVGKNVSESAQAPATTKEKKLDVSNRWISVSTVDRKDLQNETFGVEAIDYDASRAKELNEYPDMRVFHVRGLKIGKADKMYRVGKYAVDEGYFLDDEFSQVMKEEISKNNGKWKISRGFGVVEATGLCRNCGTGLTVTPYHDIVGFTCPKCKSYHVGHNSLKELRFTKARTFDITVTNIPVVPWTSVSAYSLTNQEEVK